MATVSSLLVTPDARRRLQQRYEEAMRLAARPSCDRAAVHAILAECVRDDPGSTLYLDALLANLRQWQPKGKGSWLAGWFSGSKRAVRFGPASSTPYSVLSTQYQALRDAPDQLARCSHDPQLYLQLAASAGQCDLDEIELRYLTEARRVAPDDAVVLRPLARCLTRQGRFEEAIEEWRAVLRQEPDAEAESAIVDLEPAARAAKLLDESSLPGADSLRPAARSFVEEGRFAAAEQCFARAQQASGGDLAILAEREDLRLAHSELRLAVARRRGQSDPHPKAQSLVGRMEQEHNRLEIDIFHLRSERHPHDQRLKLELARRLKRAGNYSGAIQRLEEALADPSLTAEVNLELGECWQHLRQFAKALGYYQQVAQVDAPPTYKALTSGQGALPLDTPSPITPTTGRSFDQTTLLTALYRIGVLAAAMNEPAAAKEALLRLLAIAPDYKDARERLDKLRS